MHRRLIALMVGFLGAAPCIGIAAIVVDGVLDEPEWQQARVFDQFVSTEPLTGKAAKYRTEARLITNEDGIYVGFTNYQPPGVKRVQRRFARDSEITADRNVLGIDFDGNGLSGYDFTVGAANTIQDGIFNDENNWSGDWDGIWYSQTSQDENNWYTEIHVPWTVAPMTTSRETEKNMAFYFGRVVFDESLRFAYPDASFARPTFLSDWQRTPVSQVTTSTLEWFPYVTASEDIENDDSELKAGLDVVWRPNSGTQITGAINPDFGQVESDDLVVNFSAIESFFSEKRPFFTENQTLFTREIPTDDRLVHTRRIGAQADAGDEEITDIDLALKFTHYGAMMDVGFFAVTEDDTGDSKGGDYLSTRIQSRIDSVTLGHSLTYAERDTLEREAMVNALDMDWQMTGTMRLRGQLMYSDLQQSANAFNLDEDVDAQDGAGWMEWRYAPTDEWQYQVNGTYYGEEFEMNDMGFLQRNDWLELLGSVRRDFNSHAPDSSLRSSWYELEAGYQENTDGDRLPGQISIQGYWVYRDTRELTVIGGYRPVSYDDLITRGNGVLKMDAQQEYEVKYLNPRGRALSFLLVYKAETAGTEKFSHKFEIEPQYYISDRVTLSGEVSYTYFKEWLLWEFRTQQLATYKTDLYELSINLDWYPSTRQEVRVKFQWVGVEADALQGFALSSSGRPRRSGTAVDDFSVSDTALQIRYRYELAPLSDIFLVYTRGGLWESEDTGDSPFGLFNNAWDDVIAEQIVAKIRYRF
ncbi:MAG: DUF5916 domain-containing protein [Pseudomonadales bacterium]